MRIILSRTTDPAYNLASEEALLALADEDIFMLWQNGPAVIIGRNQNAWAEVNTAYAEEHGIAVIRRLSGGGAVYHDAGNVNFTFITAADSSHGVDFAPFITPVIRALAVLGVTAAADGRNDILAGGAKISGNAQCTYRRPDGTSRLLHHGTLLLDSDLSRLSAVLRPRPEKLRAKGIASVRSRVANLCGLPGFPEMSAADFMEHLARTAVEGGTASDFTDAERELAGRLRTEKYGTWEWNYGASAAHETEHTARFPFGTVSAAYSAKNGCITGIRLWGDYFGTAPAAILEDALVGIPLRRGALHDALLRAPCPVSACIAGAEAEDIVSLILGGTLQGD